MKSVITPKKLRLLLSFAALLFGTLVLSVSLISASQAVSYEGLLATQRKLYFNESLLPDHVLYPFVAAADRLLLTVSSRQQKLELQLAFGQIRMDYAYGLFDKGEEDMAIAALTKSQKYLNQAGMQLSDFEFEQDLSLAVVNALEKNIKQSKEMIKKTEVKGRDLAIQLNESNSLLLNQLRCAGIQDDQ